VLFPWYLPSMKSLLGPLFLALLFASCASDDVGERLTKEDCAEVRTHMAELRMQSFQPSGLSAEQASKERAAHMENLAKLGGDDALVECVENKSAIWAKCSLGSQSLSEAARCR